MINETLNTYLPAVGILSLILNILLFAKWKLADKKRKEYLDSWSKCSDKLTQSYIDNSKLMSKLSEFQSKRDKHKQEQSSWAKQRTNLKKRIKELEEGKV
jgi:predicted transcriptional regulator